MSSPLDYRSRSILEYTPDISYVEPEVISEEPEQLYDEEVNENLGVIEAKAVQKMAQTVEKLAEKVQDEADKLAAGFCIELNTSTDYQAVMAMRRHFPNDNPSKICYEQYKACKEKLRKLANNVSDKTLNSLSDENIDNEFAALDNVLGKNSGDMNKLTDIVGPGATNDPKANPASQLIDPLNVEEFQDNMLRHLANFLWKKFVKPVIPLPPGISFLPDEIAPLPKGAPSPEQMMGQE